ncbi:hypothetical protein [Streptomyces sp. NBC_01320]|nr:hypothetical protein OG395_55805 [Streptomyces sp. NBC_01320]
MTTVAGRCSDELERLRRGATYEPQRDFQLRAMVYSSLYFSTT